MNAAGPTPLTLDEALARLLAAVAPLPSTTWRSVATSDARGRILAQSLESTLDVPPADNSAMDGYAVRVADVPAAGVVLPVSQRIPAGSVGTPLAPGSAARIFTGAQVPEGADAVVMQEQCEATGEGGVRIGVVPRSGQSIRRRGEDVRHGSVVLPAGSLLSPQALGLAATVGAASLVVTGRPRVALFSTGDELAMPGEALRPGAIYNSNRFMLRAAIETLGADCTDLGIVPDQREATRAALREAARDHDLIVTSGGVSVGEEDHLRPAIAAEGRLELWQVALKPGKPLAFGSIDRGDGSSAHVLGLPGNPVSSFITFLLMVAPVLRRLQGAAVLTPRRLRLRADFEWARPDRRREFLRVRHNDKGGLDLFANQGSGVLTSTVWGDGLVDNPPQQAIRPGDTVDFLPFTGVLS